MDDAARRDARLPQARYPAASVLLASDRGDLLAGMTDPDRLARRRSIVKDTTAMMSGDE